jgi:hypothetical protein
MKNVVKLGLLASLASLAACSDSMTTEPTGQPPQASNEWQHGGGSTQSLKRTDTTRFSITIDPSRKSVFDIGEGNTLTFPEGSLCDPYKSSYGEGEWDKSCVKATKALTVNVKAWLDKYGHARIDFDKDVRFVPSNYMSQWVVITFDDYEASLDPMANILYCATPKSTCKDESKKDYTLLPMKNPITRKIQRRIKHFSGYNVAAGRDEDSGSDDYRWWGALSTDRGVLVASTVPALPSRTRKPGDEGTVKPLSGYILASGNEG